ncbi:MAG: hypothetical protein EAZ08_10165 [Cytophagales bacterium]|nr:MAG: hypothetical protein EAZ08_10165 [Cytophagales bacterium]
MECYYFNLQTLKLLIKMKVKEINSFSRFINQEADTLEQIISNNERLKQELDRQLPASIHHSKAYKRAEARGLASQRSYLKRHALLNKDVQVAVQLIDNHIDTFEQNELVKKVVEPHFPVGGLLVTLLVLFFLGVLIAI